MISFFIFFFCLCAVYGVYLFSTRKATVRRARTSERLTEAMEGEIGLLPSHAPLARSVSLSEIAWLDRWLRKNTTASELKRTIEQADLPLTVGRLLLFSVLATILGIMMASIMLSSRASVVAVGLLAGGMPFLHVLHQRKKRFEKFRADLPEALEMISRALAAGHSFPAALHLVSEEMPEPIAGEFARVYEEQQVGLSLKTAMQNLMQRVPLLELKLCAIAVLVQRETGGNLAEILDTSSQTIRERFRVMEDLNTLTISSRMSAGLLVALPFVVLALIHILNPGYLDPLWHDKRGHNLLWVAGALQISGLLMVRKILRIRI